MYSSTRLALKYLQYFLTASNARGHGIHSPFVFDFITSILNDKTHYPDYDRVEQLRQQLLQKREELTVEDFGAGSAAGQSVRRKISSIAATAAKPKKYGQLLFRLVRYFQPAVLLELGTSLGISTCYLSLAAPSSRFVTLEGAPAVATVALDNFKALQLQNVRLVQGNFDDTLSATLAMLPSLDFVFIDGNHREEPTIRYFQALLPAINKNTVIVFDDIHWSKGMESAWQTVKNHASVRCSIDLFFIGLLFFREEFHETQHFSIRF